MSALLNCTEVRFARFPSGGFTTMAVINPPERKLAESTFVQCMVREYLISQVFTIVQNKLKCSAKYMKGAQREFRYFDL